MSNKPQLSKGAKEIKELAQTLRQNGLLVIAKCYAIPGAGGGRFELLLEADGQRGVVDIAGGERPRLGEVIATAIEAFTEAVQLQQGDVVEDHRATRKW